MNKMKQARSNRFVRVSFGLLLGVVLVTSSGVPGAVGAGLPPATRAELPADVEAGLLGPGYRLSPGDVLQIDVFGDAAMSGLYTVGPAGTITMPQLGQVHVRNMTLTEAREHLTERLGELLRIPYLVLSIREIESVRKVYVSGYVVAKGPQTLPFGATVVDAVIGAGLTDLADLRRVRVTHPGEQPKTLDLSGIRTDQPIDVTERVQYGDIIYVPKVRDRIAVLGFVEEPTTVYLPVGQEIRVLEAITQLAGGLAAGADTSTALLIHKDQQSEVINLYRLIREGDVAENKVLRAGDVIVINEADTISVVGEGTSPSTFRSPEPVTALEVLAQAEGFSARADLAAAQIYSKGGQTRPIDLEALWKKGDMSQNIEIYPGDVLMIPEREPETILIVGSVGKPQVLSIADVEERDVLRVVMLAGATPAADLRRVTIYREDKPLTIDVQAMMDEGQLAANIDVEPGDIVMVPEKETLYVLGAVGMQGKFPWEPNLTVLEVIARSGGLSEAAKTDEVHILRHGEGKEWDHIVVSIGEYRRGVPPDEAILQIGDIVYVPPRKVRKPILEQIRDLLWLPALFGMFD